MAKTHVALVTGGGGGLGRAVAGRLAAAGHPVALLGRSPTTLAEAAAEIGSRAIPLPCDVTDRAAVEAAVARLAEGAGPPTWLVNAAGVAVAAPLLPPDDALFDHTIQINAKGAWIVATACLPGMLQAGGGAVVNVASTAAIRGYRYTAAYVTSKHALLGLTRAMAEDLAAEDVTVNAVCPGFLDTPMTERSVARLVETTDLDADAARAVLAGMNERGALVPPDEVADVIVDLLADGSRTGEAVVIE